MHWIFCACLAASILGLSLEHNTFFEGYDLSLSGYHLCTETMVINDSQVMSYKTAYTERISCGGWLPWKMCQRTLYKTVYKTVFVQVRKETTRCCDGYEQVGSYCALPLSRSAEFTAKPGSCPERTEACGSVCEWDTDCPGFQKCCKAEGRSCCINTMAEDEDREWCLHVTIVVKTNFEDLVSKHEGILNHTRLLHAMVTGALNSSDCSVFYLRSRQHGPFSTASEILIGSSQELSLQNITSQLHLLVKHIEEVSSVEVQDMDECAHVELNNCSPDADCINTEGSYSCSCRPGFTDLSFNLTGSHCQAVQTLRGKVRLTNVEFTEAFLNSSSQDYLNFTQNIEREIIAGLSPDMQDLVYSGAVNIQITGLASGSVVVNFVMVFSLNGSQDITNVSWALMRSLQNSSKYIVDGSSSSIDDFDECLAGDADCSLFAVCENTWGSYTCTCREGFTDTNPNKRGRTCADVDECSTGVNTCHRNANCYNSVGSYNCICQDGFRDIGSNYTGRNCTAWPTTASTLSSTTLSSTSSTSSTSTTSSTSSTAANSHTTPTLTSLAPVISQEDAIVVECSANEISVSVVKEFLRSKFITGSSLYLGRQECGVTADNTSHVQLTVTWGQCGVTFQHNTTHNSAQITLYNNRTSGSLIAPKAFLEVPIVCTYRSSILISTGYAPTGYDMIKDIVEGSGTFHVTVQILNGTSPLPQNYSLSPNEEVVVEVAINSTLEQIKLVINECWATPTSNPSDSTSYFFLQNSCPVPNTYTTVLQNGNSSRSRLALRIFSFVEQSVIYLHCKIQICIETAEATCRPDCTPRTGRSINVVGIARASYGPIFKNRNGSTKDMIDAFPEVAAIILGVGIGLLLLGVLTLVCYRKRRVGHYNFNFKPNQEKFTYHVFDT
ncbi:uromodulin-like 1 [Megalops cyprinoides]|uniref:uromodulin-like 1 n=1 Tax=Megalops cyprinoides TaxID=118141 RepID=UPI001864DA40|nr:uromodulin-like 1 [Megalops cyprinoides]